MPRAQWFAKYEQMKARDRARAVEHLTTRYRIDGVELLPFQVADFLTWTTGLLAWRFDVTPVGALWIPLPHARMRWS